jgi:hypothetical protein
MNADTHNDAHHNEYLAAIAGMADHTPSPAPRVTYAIGDFVSGTTKGKRWSGRIQQLEAGRAVIEIDGGWIVIDPADITH